MRSSTMRSITSSILVSAAKEHPRMRFKKNRKTRSQPHTLMTKKQLNRRRIKRWLLTSTLIVFSGAGLSLAGWLFSNGVPVAGATARQSDISPEALAQIEALLREKDNRT